MFRRSRSVHRTHCVWRQCSLLNVSIHSLFFRHTCCLPPDPFALYTSFSFSLVPPVSPAPCIPPVRCRSRSPSTTAACVSLESARVPSSAALRSVSSVSHYATVGLRCTVPQPCRVSVSEPRVSLRL